MSNCIICNKQDNRLIYCDTLLKCHSCGFITANIDIGAEELNAIYSKNYFKGEEYLDYLSDKTTIQKNFSQRLKHINIDSVKNSNALEIGCAYGFFGELFTNKYKAANYTGLDIVSDAVNYGKHNLKLNLVLQDYLTYEAPQKYTHVFMWDVIEHLPRPDLFIEKISKDTQVGSELHITTGDISALLPKIQQQNWRMIHPPTHLHYFSKKTLTLLLENNGFKVRKIIYKPVFRSLKQIFYSLFLLNKPKQGFVNRIFRQIPNGWFVPINTFDIMYCIAVKK